MTTPTLNYGWPKPEPTEYASIAGMNTLLDNMDNTLTVVANSMGAVVKPMLQMKLNGAVSPNNLNVSSLVGTNFWEEIFNVPGTIPSTTQYPVVYMSTDGYFSVHAAGIYRVTTTINVGTYPGATEGLWLTALYNTNSIIVPRSKQVERMQTYTFGQGIHHSVLLKADTTGSPDLEVGTMSYKVGIMHDVNTSNVFISCKPYDLDPFFSSITIEYVRGL